MKKRIGLLAFLLATTGYAEDIFFNESDQEKGLVKLEESVITTTGFETNIREIPSNVTIISSQEIQEKGYTSVEEVLEKIFSSTKMLIAVHCEDEATIKANVARYKEEFGDNIPVTAHHLIRSEEACYLSSSKAIALAQKTGARLHVFHLSTAKEMSLFTNKIPLEDKQITAEVCIHHLWFTNDDYQIKGNFIKWNPAVKTENDRKVLWEALIDGRIDVIATDHAPHTLEEKSKLYLEAPSGGPLVQHAVVAMFEAYHQGKISIEKIVEKMCHNPAKIFKIEKRGFIKPGYFADLVLVNPSQPWSVKKENILYKCAWSPFEGTNFKSRITHTFVNGQLVYENSKVKEIRAGKRMLYNR